MLEATAWDQTQNDQKRLTLNKTDEHKFLDFEQINSCIHDKNLETMGDLRNRSDLVLRPNIGLRPNLCKFFKW